MVGPDANAYTGGHPTRDGICELIRIPMLDHSSSANLNTQYGSDKHGLVWGYLFTPGEPTRQVTSEQAEAFLRDEHAKQRGAFLWLHFALSNSSSALWFKRQLDLPRAFYESLHSDTGSTRLEIDDGSLIAVIHDVIFDFTFDANAVSTSSICIQPSLILSARLRPLRSIDQLRAAVRAGEAFRSPVEVLAHLLSDQADMLGNILRRTTRQVDEIEDRLLASRISASRPELGNLRRTLVRLKRLLAPEPAALFRLLNKPPAWISSEDIQELRQSAEEFSVALGDATMLSERIKLIQEELATIVNEQTNRTLFILTLVTVLALPINIASGLFGMNIGGIPLHNHPYGFALVASILALATGLAAYFAIVKRRE